MSNALRLPYIIKRFILEKWLGIKSEEKIDDDKSIPAILDQQQISTPFFAHFTGSCISDNFYYIPASSSINLPSDSFILVTDWNLGYNEVLHLNILQAELVEESKLNKLYLVNIEKNPCVACVLRRFKYEKMRKCVVDDVNDRDHKEGLEEVQGVLNGNVEGSKVGDLVSIKSEDDGCDMIDNYTDPGVSCNRNSNYRIEDVGIDVFPPYALEYLKHKYNII